MLSVMCESNDHIWSMEVKKRKEADWRWKTSKHQFIRSLSDRFVKDPGIKDLAKNL